MQQSAPSTNAMSPDAMPIDNKPNVCGKAQSKMRTGIEWPAGSVCQRYAEIDSTMAARGAMSVMRVTMLAAVLAIGPASRMRGQFGMSISIVADKRRILRMTEIESSETIRSIGVAVAMAMAARWG